MKRELSIFAIFATTLLAAAPKCPAPSVSMHNAPVLALKDINNVATVNLKSDADSIFCISEVAVAIEATESLNDLHQVNVLSNGKSVAAKDISIGGKRATIIVPCTFSASSFDIAVKTSDAVNLDNKFRIRSVAVKTTKGRIRIGLHNPLWLRMGVALRVLKQDGVAGCRIPGLAITPKGTLIAVYDARRTHNHDLQGDIDICYNRSTDGGRTWSEMKVAMDMGEWGGLPQKFNGIADPCILVDENTGNLFISACWMHGVIDKNTGVWIEGLTEDSKDWNHQYSKNGSHPGYGIRQSCQWMVVKSTDDGMSWSEPMNCTRQVKPESYCIVSNCPGAGITLEDGTLVIPAQGKREDETQFSTIITSRDGGQTWISGTPAISDHSINSSECMAVQLADGSIMINMRSTKNKNNHETNGRLVCTTKDLGQTWTEHPTSGHVLTEPTCQGTLFKHMYRDRSGKEHELLLFFNPDDPDNRIHYTLKCSLDEGMTWPENMWLEVDEYKGRGYSCLVSLDNDTLGLLYEGSGACLTFMKIKISEFLKLPR